MTQTATETVYRRFTTKVVESPDSPTGKLFLITEVESTTKHPLNWIGVEVSAEGAHHQAKRQDNPVRVLHLSGRVQDLGIVFDPRDFEQAAHSDYVCYGISMTDGYYAPIKFEDWVKPFRREVRKLAEQIARTGERTLEDLIAEVFYANDAASEVKQALFSYACAVLANPHLKSA